MERFSLVHCNVTAPQNGTIDSSERHFQIKRDRSRGSTEGVLVLGLQSEYLVNTIAMGMETGSILRHTSL